MKIEYKTTFGGYITLLRASQILLKKINFSQFGAYICFVSQADFDRRHKNYGYILRDDEELAKAWGMDSTTVYKQRKKLIKVGLLAENESLTYVPNFYMFELSWVKDLGKLPLEKLKPLIETPQNNAESLLKSLENFQSKQPRNDTQSSKVSSNDGISASDKEFIDKSLNINGDEEENPW